MRPVTVAFRTSARRAVLAVAVGAGLVLGLPGPAQGQPAQPVAAARQLSVPVLASPVPTTGPRLTRVVAFARWAVTQHIHYVYAGGHGSGPGPSLGGLDCSGFTRWAYAQVGWDLGSGSSESQRTSGKLVRTNRPVPGDLVFFANGGAAYHAGLYIGRDTDGTPLMVNAPYTGVDVRIDRFTKHVMGYYHPKDATSADSLPLKPPPPPASAPPASKGPLVDGDFVLAPGTRWTFRIAGGAPIFVSAWRVYGTAQPTRLATAAQWAALAARPKDGTFLRDATTHLTYRVTGGAPVLVSTWAAVGGSKPYVVVDPAALTRAGQAAPWNHLLPHPLDGTILRGWPSGIIYRVAGGAPLAFANPRLVPAGVAVNQTQDQDMSRAGQPGPFKFLTRYPVTGTFIRGINQTRTYIVRDGRAVYIPSWAPFGRAQPFTFVDQAVIDRAGGPAPFDHLRR